MASGVAPLASATSGGDFRIDEALVKVKGVPTWPVMDGQTVESLKAPVAVSFPKKAELALCNDSKVKVSQTHETVLVHLTDGSLTWRLLQPGMLSINVGGTIRKVESEVGTFSAPGSKSPKQGCLAPMLEGMNTSGMSMQQKVLMGSAFAATGVTIGAVAVTTSRPPPVSRRR
jgi:hypothetical protein